MLINISDLKDPDDTEGRTYREINNATPHKYSIGQLVEFEDGVRLFITKLVRDCDGTPLYQFGFDGNTVRHNYSKDSFVVISAEVVE